MHGNFGTPALVLTRTLYFDGTIAPYRDMTHESTSGFLLQAGEPTPPSLSADCSSTFPPPLFASSVDRTPFFPFLETRRPIELYKNSTEPTARYEAFALPVHEKHFPPAALEQRLHTLQSCRRACRTLVQSPDPRNFH